jgi:hypothetical protein
MEVGIFDIRNVSLAMDLCTLGVNFITIDLSLEPPPTNRFLSTLSIMPRRQKTLLIGNMSSVSSKETVLKKLASCNLDGICWDCDAEINRAIEQATSNKDCINYLRVNSIEQLNAKTTSYFNRIFVRCDDSEVLPTINYFLKNKLFSLVICAKTGVIKKYADHIRNTISVKGIEIDTRNCDALTDEILQTLLYVGVNISHFTDIYKNIA